MKKKQSRTILVRALIIGICSLGALSVGVPQVFAATLPGAGKTIQPMTTGRADHYFQHFIVQIGLEQLGYTVDKHLEAQFPAIHLSIGLGDADYTAVHWNPLHIKFYEKSGGGTSMQRVGKLVEGAAQGYLIDKATADKYNITNLAQLKDPKLAKLFDSDDDGKANLTGCNPGWGCEGVIEHQLDAFKLRDTVDHNQGIYFALIADTITRYKAGESILYYTWSPLWVSSILKPGIDTVWLDVPFSSLPGRPDADTKMPNGKNSGFTINTVGILANDKFLAENPAAKKFFELVTIPIDDINTAILRQYDGEKTVKQVRKHAEEWVKQNQTQFSAWVEAAKQASN
jgi:glycine betaine/proline transport system substrate-binding protein